GSCFGGGGGGSSFTHASVTGVTQTQGVRIGSGQVIITSIATTLTTPTGFTGSSTVCAGSTGTYSVGAVAGATSYTWSVPAGATINSGQGTTSINVTFGTTSGNISVTADDACGSSTPSTQAITVNAAPVVALGADVAQCGGAVSLDAGNAGSTYLWSNSGTTQMINVSSSGIYSVAVSNAAGCVGRDTIQVLIHPLPVVALGADVTQCGGSVMLDAGNSGVVYLWSNSSTTQMITVSASGIYSVMVSDVNGCNGMDTVSVTINPLPVVALGADVTQCGGSVMLDAGNAGVAYLWSNSSTTQMITVSAGGIYSVMISDVNGCNGMDTVSVTINPIPVVTAAAANTTPCLADGAVTLTGSPSGGTWTGPGVSGNSFDPSAAGVGTHQLVYTYMDSATTCMDTAQVGTVVDICTNIVSENATGAVSIFPNPVTDQLQVQSDETLISYVIVDVTGRAVNAGSFATGQPKQIDVTALPAGTYLLQTTTDNGEIRTAQFVKK
ncbi:MAG TPA: T9SS type A sorting domain-containing protein, partial [Bacteroidia bacterium]|nr:T9SS type A sorting domain-containing protein [Bacteroidia bacterium]